MSRTLARFDLHFKSSRDHVHSPDPHYVAKLADIVAALRACLDAEGRYVVVFLDEFSFYRQPTGARAWCLSGADQQPLAERSHHSNTCGRVVGGLDALTGQVTAQVASKITLTQLVAFWQELRRRYPQAEKIYVVLDNWPVHFHPDVLAALEPQQTRFELKTPANWPTAPCAKAQQLNLPIQLLPLPTYASWCNPIEKLWRKLQQELLHLHRDAPDWPALRAKVKAWLERFVAGSKDLLRYVGLTEQSKLYGALFGAAQAQPG